MFLALSRRPRRAGPVLAAALLAGAGLLGLVAVAPTAGAAPNTNVLVPGESLARGQYLQSPNGLFRTTLQNDGNLVTTRTSDGAILWDARSGGCDTLVVQATDGNTVCYQGSASRFDTGGGANRLVQQDDGALVAYRPDDTTVWANNRDWRLPADSPIIGTWSQRGNTVVTSIRPDGYKGTPCTNGNKFYLTRESATVYTTSANCSGTYVSEKWTINGNVASVDRYTSSFNPPNSVRTYDRL